MMPFLRHRIPLHRLQLEMVIFETTKQNVLECFGMSYDQASRRILTFSSLFGKQCSFANTVV